MLAFVAAALAIAGVIATAGVSLFPFLLPSSLDPDVQPDGVGRVVAATTLLIMTVATVILLPIVLAYTAWVYRVLRGPVTRGGHRGRSAHRPIEESARMWYFSWVLGLGFAAAFAALNAMWLELAPGKGLPD